MDNSKWTQEPPTEAGEYWHWNGCQSCAPLPMFIGGGYVGKCFVRIGQLGITKAIDCDKYGGWWLAMQAPQIPEAPQCHCQICDS